MIAREWVPDRQEIIWINFHPQSGREMKDHHPMLVISPYKFNQKTGLVIGVPMTSASYNDTHPFAVKFIGHDDKISYILAHQPKSFDWQLRGAKLHPWKKLPSEEFTLVCDILNQIMQLSV